MTPVIKKAVSTFVPTDQQKAIGRWVAKKSKKHTKPHLIVRARAGTGKTTTIVWVVKYAPEDNILVTSFSSDIVKELRVRFEGMGNVKARTSHSVGNGLIFKAYGRIEVLEDKRKRADALTTMVADAAPKQVQRLISKLHTLGRETLPHATDWNELVATAETYECEPEDQHIWDGYDVEYICRRAVECMTLASEERTFRRGIDFADMIFLPLRNGLLRPMFEMGFIDEAQDMTPAQLELLMGVIKRDGRIVLVGDDRQAIYGFRGADVHSLDRLKAELDADELGLTKTRRCGKVIVAEAAELVPDFEAWDTNDEGEIIHLPYDKIVATAQLGDFVLSRLNAPLVKVAMSLLRNKKRTVIAGRAIGEQLIRLVDKLSGYSTSMAAFLENLRGWTDQQVTHWMSADRPDRIALVHDQEAMLMDLASSSDSVEDLKDRIAYLFTDDGLGEKGVITCSTIHRAKGREADRVFVLTNTLYPFGHTREEENMHYVAITRAKKTLFLVI